MQAIQTKYLRATDCKPSRIVAICAAGQLLQSKQSLEEEEVDFGELHHHEKAHYAAAWKLANKLGWIDPHYGRLIGGGLKDGSYVWVFSESWCQVR